MKKIKLLLSALIMLTTAWSCEEKDNLEPIGQWELSTPAIANPATNATITLNDDDPTIPVRFEWSPAVSSKNYNVRYTWVLDSANNADFSTPILSLPSTNGGKGLFVAPTALQIDQALSAVGYPTNSSVNLRWTVIASSLSKESMAPVQNVTMKRFETEKMPSRLYLLANNAVVAELAIDGNKFRSKGYLPLQAGVNYTLNTARTGTGTTYSLAGIVGQSNNATDNSVSGSTTFAAGSTALTVARDQAYTLTFDFQTGKVDWKYYNLKVFHWNNSGGWDARTETLMTYVHPYKFEATVDMKAGFDTKFNSPWDVQFGTDAIALTGTMTNGGANYKGITQDGTYKATIVVSSDFKTGAYSFVKQ